MKKHNSVMSITLAGLLCAIGIIIPMFAPKIVIEPASFTLASHVPVFIAMFISPTISIAVALLTSLGFLISGTPIIIVLRALTHIIFATLGALILKKNNNVLLTTKSAAIYSFFISLVHAIAEVVVVTLFYWGGNIAAYEEKGYFFTVIVLVGIGTLIHSMIDFSIAVFVWKPLHHIISIPFNAKVKSRAMRAKI